RHVGYYLLDRGRRALEERIAYRPSRRVRARSWLERNAETVYFGATAVVAAAIGALVLAAAAPAFGTIGFALAVLLAIAPSLSAAIALVNHVIVRVLPPRVLPRMDFSNGIPPTPRTLVAVPALLSSAE